MNNNQWHRIVVAVICGTIVYCCASALGAGPPMDECNSDDPERVVSGCSAVLERTTDSKQRAIGLIRRGEAYEKKGDLGAAVIDFIAASDADPQNFYARADLDRVSPHAAPKS